MADAQGQQKQSSGAALRAYLVTSKQARPSIGVVLGSIKSLFANLQADKLLVAESVGVYALHVVAAGHAVELSGKTRRAGEKAVPVIAFKVDGRPVHVTLACNPDAASWTWNEGAGIGVDGLAISPETTSLVFLKLLSGEV